MILTLSFEAIEDDPKGTLRQLKADVGNGHIVVLTDNRAAVAMVGAMEQPPARDTSAGAATGPYGEPLTVILGDLLGAWLRPK